MWYLIVSIPDLCTLIYYIQCSKYKINPLHAGQFFMPLLSSADFYLGQTVCKGYQMSNVADSKERVNQE